jgi:transcription elongation factor GreA
MEAEYLTKEKYSELEKELEYLKTAKRKEVADALEYAKSLGDLSENQEYQEARDSQAILEDRIKHLEKVLKTASIVSSNNAGIVAVGSVITVEKDGGKEKKSYTIVGSEEANAALGKISLRSPLGLGAIGKKKGESFSFQTPSGTMSYKIVDIK